MPAGTTNLTTSAAVTNAEFRLLVQFISDALEAGGVIKTTDTGQIDYTSVNYPGSNNTAAGYEIRRFSDAMQATKPVFIKIEYGRAGTASSFGVYITIGTGSDGSGNITGIRRSRDGFPMYMNNAAMAAVPCYISVDTNRFCFAINHIHSSAGYMGLERTIDSDGAVTDQGLLFAYRPGASSMVQEVLFHTGTNPPVESTGGGGSLPPAQQTSGQHTNGNVAVYPQFFFGIGETLVPGKNACGVFSADFTPGNTYTVSLLGTNHTMMCLNKTGAYGINRGGSGVAPTSSNFTMLMRYE